MKPVSRRTREGGSISVELVVLAPALGLVIAGAVFGGRVALAEQAVQTAAADAARVASIARSPGQASTEGQSAGAASLANQDLRCSTSSVVIDTAAFATPVGTAGQVRATITCRVDLSDLVGAGIPGTRTVISTASSPLDSHRARGG